MRRAHKLDATNEITIRYMHELEQSCTIRKRRRRKRRKKHQTVTYNLGNETIIQPVSASLKDNAELNYDYEYCDWNFDGSGDCMVSDCSAINHSKSTKIRIKMWLHTVIRSPAKESQISALQKQVEDYQPKEKELEAEKQKAANTQEQLRGIVIDVIAHYNQNILQYDKLIDELLALSTDSLGEVGKAQYDEMTSEIFPKQCDNRLHRPQDRVIEWKIMEQRYESLEKVMKMNEGYEDGKALLLLADSYARKWRQETRQTEKYNRVIELFPDSDVAQKAQKH